MAGNAGGFRIVHWAVESLKPTIMLHDRLSWSVETTFHSPLTLLVLSRSEIWIPLPWHQTYRSKLGIRIVPLVPPIVDKGAEDPTRGRIDPGITHRDINLKKAQVLYNSWCSQTRILRVHIDVTGPYLRARKERNLSSITFGETTV